ncbi:hypothetical protein BDZ97DRAFT_1790928 [Flammula alnicola]|nr:hypothetical protein BDZ97DRAFT_1790928 [Flammula alnicola]
MPAFVFTVGSLGDILATAGLAAQVVKVLYDNKNIAKECETLAIELRSLQSVLILTEYALQRYSSTPLGEPMAHIIQPEVAQCHLSLAQFSDNINVCRRALSVTNISSLWRRVVWAASDEAATLSAKLSNHRSKLTMLLISLNSVGLMDLESTCFGGAQAGLYNTLHNPSSVRRIKDNTIDVLDHLGDTMPISTLFCGTWEAFHYVVKGYCKNRIGQSYVERGDYQIIRPESNQIIRRSDFARIVKDGEMVEISIILRSHPAIEEDEGRCPRCAHLNTHAPSDGGWIRWSVAFTSSVSSGRG